MKRSTSLLLTPGLAASALVAVSAAPAHAADPTCTQLWRSANATQYTCTSRLAPDTFQFRTWVKCKRPGLPTFSYLAYGPYRGSGGTSAAYCDRQSGDYRVEDGTQGVA